MPKNKSRRAGLTDQRDRGRKRHQDIKRRTEASDDRQSPEYAQALEDWIPSYFHSIASSKEDGASAKELLAIPFKDYLRASGQFEIPPDDRLRFLAIAIEEVVSTIDVLVASHERWRAADRIYKEAIRLDPEYGPHRSSRALTSHYLSQRTTKLEDKMTEIALVESVRGTELDRSAKAFSIAGQCHYDHHTGRALELFDEALAFDPESLWPLLYRAHCLHDLRRYDEALHAYRRIPKDQLVGTGHASRLERLRQQIAHCQLELGESEARQAFEDIIDRFEAEPHVAMFTPWRYLDKASATWPDLETRIEALKDAIVAAEQRSFDR